MDHNWSEKIGPELVGLEPIRPGSIKILKTSNNIGKSDSPLSRLAVRGAQNLNIDRPGPRKLF